MEQQQIIEAINKKYRDMGENPDTYLKGILQAKPINYWAGEYLGGRTCRRNSNLNTWDHV